jgi:hypothetical protein
MRLNLSLPTYYIENTCCNLGITLQVIPKVKNLMAEIKPIYSLNVDAPIASLSLC